MILKEWMQREMSTRELGLTELVEKMAESTGVSTVTISNAWRGRKFARYDKAKAVSDYTGGIVTVKELCEG